MPYLKSCTDILPIGRLIWIPGTDMNGRIRQLRLVPVQRKPYDRSALPWVAIRTDAGAVAHCTVRNPNGWVGRGLTDHFVDAVTGRMPFDTGSSRGPGCLARIDFPGIGMLEAVGETPGLRAGLSAFSAAGIPGYYDNGLGGPLTAQTLSVASSARISRRRCQMLTGC
jgi:hypothetical protein